jgi:hypothetical protein
MRRKRGLQNRKSGFLSPVCVFHVYACFQQDGAAPVGLAQQLSAEVVSILGVLTQYAAQQGQGRSSTCDTVWQLLRPMLRVILWLLPQHVMQAADGTATNSHSRNCNGVGYITSIATVSWFCLQEAHFCSHSCITASMCTAVRHTAPALHHGLQPWREVCVLMIQILCLDTGASCGCHRALVLGGTTALERL